MARNFTVSVSAVIVAALGGCGGYTGVAPDAGFNTEHVSYEPTLLPDATVVEIPLIDPTDVSAAVLALPEPHVWKPKMPIAFTGEIKRFNARQNGIEVRLEITPIHFDGSLGPSKSAQVVARLKERGANLAYLINYRAPDKPGRYHVAIKTVGPSHDHDNLDTFVEGDVEVR